MALPLGYVTNDLGKNLEEGQSDETRGPRSKPVHVELTPTWKGERREDGKGGLGQIWKSLCANPRSLVFILHALGNC